MRSINGGRSVNGGPSVNGGRSTAMIAAPATLAVGLAVAATPWGPWTTVFLLVAPALPAVVLWRALEAWVRLLLAGTVAVVVDAVVAEVMLATGTWSPPGGVTAVAVISASLWVGTAVAWNVMSGDQQERTS